GVVQWGVGAAGTAAGGEGAPGGGGGVAVGAVRARQAVGDLAAPPLREERGALEGTQACPDSDCLQVVDDGLGEIREGGIAGVVAGIEAIRIAGLGQKLAGVLGIVRNRRRWPRGLEGGGDDAPRTLGES